MTFYSAVCPVCGAPVTGTLDSEPDVPFYECGAYGYGKTCPRRDSATREPANVHALTVAEAAELAIILGSGWAGLLHFERARGR